MHCGPCGGISHFHDVYCLDTQCTLGLQGMGGPDRHRLRGAGCASGWLPAPVLLYALLGGYACTRALHACTCAAGPKCATHPMGLGGTLPTACAMSHAGQFWQSLCALRGRGQRPGICRPAVQLPLREGGGGGCPGWGQDPPPQGHSQWTWVRPHLPLSHVIAILSLDGARSLSL